MPLKRVKRLSRPVQHRKHASCTGGNRCLSRPRCALCGYGVPAALGLVVHVVPPGESEPLAERIAGRPRRRGGGRRATSGRRNRGRRATGGCRGRGRQHLYRRDRVTSRRCGGARVGRLGGKPLLGRNPQSLRGRQPRRLETVGRVDGPRPRPRDRCCGRLRALTDPAYPRKRDAQLAAFASLLERFTGGDGERVLILARGNRQNARPVAGPLPWRQHAESENLEHPPPVADRRLPASGPAQSGGGRCGGGVSASNLTSPSSATGGGATPAEAAGAMNAPFGATADVATSGGGPAAAEGGACSRQMPRTRRRVRT